MGWWGERFFRGWMPLSGVGNRGWESEAEEREMLDRG